MFCFVFFFSNAVCFSCFFFFFQAEDGIRDWSVTGVQTCALPISSRTGTVLFPSGGVSGGRILCGRDAAWHEPSDAVGRRRPPRVLPGWSPEIGRASCRERV